MRKEYYIIIQPIRILNEFGIYYTSNIYDECNILPIELNEIKIPEYLKN